MALISATTAFAENVSRTEASNMSRGRLSSPADSDTPKTLYMRFIRFSRGLPCCSARSTSSSLKDTG